MFDYIVIGKGLIGSAAARYLSANGNNVAVIGPDEPADWQAHQGVFASHYDQGRITRILDPDPIWAILAKRSIAQYAAIEQKSGIKFHHPTCGLRVAPDSAQAGDIIANLLAVGRRLEVDFEKIAPSHLNRRCPLFDFPAGVTGVWESGQAGYINPRSLVAAQLEISRRQGLSIITETVTAIEGGKSLAVIKTDQGHSYQAPKVLIATGAYANMLFERRLDLRLIARTILLAELAESEAARLKSLPTLIYKLPGNPPVPSIYMLPPVKYPDGKHYIKIGGSLTLPIICDSVDELRDWFHSDGSQDEAEGIQEVLLSIIPNLRAESFHCKPCVTTYTPTDHPYIDIVDAGQLFIAVAGCGHAAKSSNELGRIAAKLVENNGWDYDIDRATFKMRFVA